MRHLLCMTLWSTLGWLLSTHKTLSALATEAYEELAFCQWYRYIWPQACLQLVSVLPSRTGRFGWHPISSVGLYIFFHAVALGQSLLEQRQRKKG